MALKTDSIQTSQKWVLRTGVAFLVACVIHAAIGGWALAEGDNSKRFVYVLIMVSATIGTALLPTILAYAWAAARWGVVATVAIGIVASVTVEAVGNLLALGHTRQVSISSADKLDRTVSDTRADIAQTERSIRVLEATREARAASAGWLSTKPASAWAADIANLEGHALYARSRQCATVTLPDSRAHCDKLAEARANKAVAEAHERESADLARLTAKITELRERAKGDAPGASAARTQADNLVRLAHVLQGGWSDGAAESERARANFMVELVMVAFMIIGPAILIYAGHIDWSARPARQPMSARIAGIVATVNRWRSGEAFAPQAPTADPPARKDVVRQPEPEAQSYAVRTQVRRLADLLPNARAA